MYNMKKLECIRNILFSFLLCLFQSKNKTQSPQNFKLLEIIILLSNYRDTFSLLSTHLSSPIS